MTNVGFCVRASRGPAGESTGLILIQRSCQKWSWGLKQTCTRTGAEDKKDGRPASMLALALPAPPFQMTSCCPSSSLPRQIRFIFISGGLETKISARHVALLNTKATRSKRIGGEEISCHSDKPGSLISSSDESSRWNKTSEITPDTLKNGFEDLFLMLRCLNVWKRRS